MSAMTRSAISAEIKSTEQKLAALRAKMADSTPKTGWHVAYRKDGVLKSHKFLGSSVGLSVSLGGKPSISTGYSNTGLTAKGKPYFIVWATI
jgi:hypothetical protein